MKDLRPRSEEARERLNTWLYVLLMREYGFNIYNDESFPWKINECSSVEEVDNFFNMVLDKSMSENRAIASLKAKEAKVYDIKSR